MIQLQNVTFQYSKTSRLFTFPDWQVPQGEHRLLLGTSGSGKTTLLHLLAGLRQPTSGQVQVGEEYLSSLKGPALDRYRGQRIGLVFQKPYLIHALTLEKNLQLTQYLAGLPQDLGRINEVLDTLGIAHRRQALVPTLSQGEAQRASIARAVLNQPQVILADEPTSSLDDENCVRVLDLLQQQAENYQATLIIATHDQRLKGQISQHLTITA